MLKNNYDHLFEISRNIIYFILIFFLPLFLLTSTREFFITNKLYLLAFGALLLLIISTVQLFISKKFVWSKRPFDSFILLFLIAMTVSVIFSSPNKVQALLNPSFGLVMMVSLAILYFYLSRIDHLPSKISHLGPIVLSLITIFLFFQPLKNISLPQFLEFIKNPGFTPIGSQLDLAVFLGFFVIWGIFNVIQIPDSDKIKGSKRNLIIDCTLLTINLLGLFLALYALLRPATTNILTPNLILPPFRLSWFSALEILKNPLTALIGAGLDNFSSIFTRIKDLAYNQSPLWQINAFNVSRSAILQVLTETGILGLVTFGLLVFNIIKSAFAKTADKQFALLFIYLLICLLVLPTSLIVWFLFFITLGLINQTLTIKDTGFARKTPTDFDLSNFMPIYVGTVVIAFILIAISGYFLGRSYASEYYFKKSLDGVLANNAKQVYDNQRRAIILNPFIERFHSNFAQTNLLIANNLTQKDPKQITEQDRQIISQAVQAAIAEGKAVVSLNPQRADGWQNLASIYLNIINAAQGADGWTISAYQRAILLDPQNPTYRIGLGGVYYSLKKYDDASIFFEQAISLKPDWPNASYNYAWANFQMGNYPQAVNAMQNALSLIDPKLNKADYDKAQKELEDFKKMLPQEESQDVE